MSDSDKCPKCEATMERSVLREAPSYYGVERHEVGGFECVTRQLGDANNRYRDLVEALGITSHQSDADVIAYARQLAADAIGGEVKDAEVERLVAAISTPEVYAGVISGIVERDRDAALAACAELYEIAINFDESRDGGYEMERLDQMRAIGNPGQPILDRLHAAEGIVKKLAKFRFSFDKRDQDNGAYRDEIYRLQRDAKAAEAAKENNDV